MAQLISVKLSRFDGSPWGFRLQGGKDFGTPLIVQKVNGGSPAEQAGLRAGDAVIRVNNTDMFSLRHKDAQDVIVRSGNSFEMTVQRGGSTWRPSVSPVTASLPSPQPSAPAASISPVTKTSLAAKKQEAPLIGSGHNFTPKPFLNGSSEGPIKSIVNKQYNSPVGIYSEETIAETLSAQAEVLAGGVLGVNFKKNERNYNAENSEVFKMVQEADKEPRSPEPAEPAPHSGVITPSSPAIAGLRSVSAPETKPQPTTPQSSLPPGQNICADCERLIVGVFVRIKEKNLHVECFKCSTCGTSLKNVGYYNINNKLYCDIHAKLVARQQAPAGLSPITIPPGGKAPAGTISAALGAHLGGSAPMSPPLNSHGSPLPFSTRNHRRPSGDLGVPQRRSSRTDLPSFCMTNGTASSTNGTSVGYDDRDSYSKQDSCNAKTYTSTITIRTGNEVGRLDDRVNELFLDDNRNPTNKLYVSHECNVTRSDNNVSRSSPATLRKIKTENDVNNDGESRFIVYNEPLIGNNSSDDENRHGSCNETSVTRHRRHEPAVVNTCGVPHRYQITNQRLKSGIYSSYHPSNDNQTSSAKPSRPNHDDDRTSELQLHVNGREPDNSNANIANRGYQSITQRLGYGSYDTSFVTTIERSHENGTREAPDAPRFEYLRNNRTLSYENDSKDSNGFNKNNRVASGYRAPSLNGRSDSSTSCFANSRNFVTNTFTSTPKPPTPPPQSPTFLTSSHWTPQSATRPNRLGTPPVDTPSFRPVQSHTSNNISGPKPFGGSSVVAPSSLVSPPIVNSGSNTLPRPQSQTVTARYFEESDFYEVIEAPIEEPSRSRCECQQPQQQQQSNRDSCGSSLKNKNLVWPPVKPIEDITYPTASPIWIDPNPVLDKRPRHNVREKRTTLQEAADSLCGSRCGSRCNSRYEEREYERYSSSSRVNTREASMDRASCAQPFYRKTEVTETRRECRAPVYTPRPSSADGVRRSLTPTRISQPIPRPWMATVTSGTSVYGHVEPPPQPEPETVCTQICRCQIICERTSGPQGPEHEQRHTYREVSCELCRPKPPPPAPCQSVCPYAMPEEPEPQEASRETDSEVVDLSKVVPPDVAVCPKGVESQHNMFTETMEKDVGDIHIKKTTIYEKTVELLSPDRAMSPEPEQAAITDQDDRPCQVTTDEETFQRSSVTLDREVENISDRRSVVESTEVLSSAIDTARIMEEARKEEEAKRQEYEKICREEEERLRRLEEECREQERRYEEEKARRKEKKRVAFSGQQKSEVIEESCRPQECYRCEKYMRQEETACEPQVESEERYRELTEEIKIQENFQQMEEQRRQSLREQVEAHQNIREQQPQTPEKRQSLQERRLCARFRDSPAERQAREQEQQQQQRCPMQQQQQCPMQQQQQPTSETCQRKHVQFMTHTETETRPLPPTTIKNATAKEWKSEMVKALTTAPARPYSPFDASAASACPQQSRPHQEDGETTSRTVYSKEIRYEETCKPCPRPAPAAPPRCENRPVSPFQDALMTAPERPYTPLGRETGEGFDSVICVDRSQTPVNSKTPEGYCHPAEILYVDDKTREARSRERNLRKVEGPQPLPTPPMDHRLRDSSASPARSLSRPGTPKDRSMMTGLKKPGTIPSYQRYLVSMEHDAVESCSFDPSRSPTPNRSKSPAQGPPEPPACFVKAQAPRIRESPPPCRRTFMPPCQQSPCQPPSASRPEHRECVSYHMEEDTPSGHRAQAYHGVRRSYYSDDSSSQSVCKSSQQRVEEDYERSDQNSAVAIQRDHEDAPSCGIGKVNRVQPSLACPLANCSGSERFPKTGVRVLPPCPPQPSSSQTYETRRISHEHRTTTNSSSCNSSAFASKQVQSASSDSNCANSGVTIMPCKATSGSGTKAGIVIMPCEGPDNSSCSRAGICVTPTPDRSGVCVSPAAHGKSASNCSKPSSGPRSGGCTIDIGNCPASGVRVAACDDGSVCVAPCSIPGYAPVQCPKPILKSPCPKAGLPYPQIPLPNEPEDAQPCDGCPLKSQQEQQQPSSCPATNDQSFQPIRETRTNLSNQLTRLTVRRDKHVVQLFKPQAQSQSQSQCLITDTQCQSKTQFRGAPNPGPICNTQKNVDPPNLSSQPDLGSGIGAPGAGGRSGKFAGSSAPKRGRGILNQGVGPGTRQPLCGHCNGQVRGPFISALGQIWCPDHFICVNSQCRRALQDIGFVEEKGQLHCEYCFERFIAPGCNKCNNKIKGECLNAVGKHFHPECFNCSYCGKLFGNSPFFLEDGLPYCESDWHELFTTKCYACGFPVEAGDRWVEALNNNYHSQCFNCTMCKKNLEGQTFYAKGGRPFCKNHAR